MIAVCHSSPAENTHAEDNLTYTENVAYDTASSTLRMSSLAKVTCTENIAYSTVKEPNDDSMRIKATGHTPIYDEVVLQ